MRYVLMSGLYVLLLASVLLPAGPAFAEGSRSLYPASATGARANLEWRSSSYGNGLLLRRTLLKVYANAGEAILLGSSAVNAPGTINNGDIRIYAPGLVSGQIGNETIAPSPTFSCLAQRTATNNINQGRISSRAQELAGPDTIINPATAQPGSVVANGYVPCFYQAPQTGIYSIVFWGPTGGGRDSETQPTGALADTPGNFDSSQDTSIAAWDVTIRANLASTSDLSGRLFTYYLTMFTGANGRLVNSKLYIVTRDGYRYEVALRGMDPNGYVLYGNQVGFLNSDGAPLYRDVMADPLLGTKQQNQLVRLQGGVSLARPEFPIFFQPPDIAALAALSIPLTPQVPQVSNLSFTGTDGVGKTRVGKGGTFRFSTTVGGIYELIISADGKDFTPDLPKNRVLRNVQPTAGLVTIEWDGKANNGENFPELQKDQFYRARVAVRGGEFHFPFLDVENSRSGGPTIMLSNPPGGTCPPWNVTCTMAFYDDRSYRTAGGVLVGTAVDGPLCPNNVGSPPVPLVSNSVTGYDTRSGQRGFGFTFGGNPATICDPTGGFGDKKGLDVWVTFPGNSVDTTLEILPVTVIGLLGFSASASNGAVELRWETSYERDTLGFHLLRSATGQRADAQQVTQTLIPAQGGRQLGAAYSWRDTQVQAGARYHYWLEEIEQSGTRREYGPASISLPGHSATRAYLPLLAR